MWDLLVSQHKRIEQLEQDTQLLRRALEDQGVSLNSSNIPTLVEEGVAATPTTATGLSFTSPSQFVSSTGQRVPSDLLTPRPPLQRNGSERVVRHASQSGRNRPGAASGPLPSSPTPPVEPTTPHHSTHDRAARSKEHAKSFRVNMEDPCWKVLPAALKKYKINDDWKMYALFICFGNTGELRVQVY